MARNYARITTDAWSNVGWRSLRMDEQWMFLFILTQSKLNLAGVIDVKLRSWAGANTDLGVDQVVAALEGLERHGFIAWDRDTDEIAIRTFVRHDGVMKNQNLGRGMWSAWSSTESRFLRDFLVDNLPDEAWNPRFLPPVSMPKRPQEPRSEPRSEPPSEPSTTSTTTTTESCIRGNENRWTPTFKRDAVDNDATTGASLNGSASVMAGTNSTHAETEMN